MLQCSRGQKRALRRQHPHHDLVGLVADLAHQFRAGLVGVLPVVIQRADDVESILERGLEVFETVPRRGVNASAALI